MATDQLYIRNSHMPRTAFSERIWNHPGLSFQAGPFILKTKIMDKQLVCIILAAVWLLGSVLANDKNAMIIANIFIATSFVVGQIKESGGNKKRDAE